MKIETIQIEENDIVMIHHIIGNMRFAFRLRSGPILRRAAILLGPKAGECHF